MMNKEFVPYEIALKLKELGFNEPCLGYYIIHSKELATEKWSEHPNKSSWTINAPLWQQVIDWFANRLNWYIETPMFIFQEGLYDGCYGFNVQIKTDENYKVKLRYEAGDFPTLYKARQHGIEVALEIAEKIIL